MPFIRTVTGDIDPDQLGVCYPHEHVLGGPPLPDLDPDLTLDSEEAAIQELTYFRQAGGNALVEMSPIDYKRDVAGLKRVSQATGIHIICTSGQHKEKFSRPWVENETVASLTTRFIAEVSEGIDGTDVRAGVIKAASSLNTISDNERKVFEAVALAHQETGAPVTTHTEAGTMGMKQIELLVSRGVDPAHIIIGHVDRKLEWEYHLDMAQAGVFLCYDQLSKEKYYPDARRVEFILRLVEAGYGGQIVLAGDLARKSYWPSYGTGGGPGLTYILWRFVPWLRTEGLSQAAIDDLLIHNPARALTFQ
jgi:phosphotriesterase-related protein